jgi:transposase
MAELVSRLRAVDGLAGIALEATRHLVVHTLSSHGFTVYPVNPKMAAAWRKGWSVTGAKSDPGDAEILADGLRHYQERLRPLRPDNPRARELALLCEDEQGPETQMARAGGERLQGHGAGRR